jgi:hypothetical protein
MCHCDPANGGRSNRVFEIAASPAAPRNDEKTIMDFMNCYNLQ